ncbi:phosphonate ABC transporter, permease protein PhnE [Candidatus Epulonipiscioides gigas]|nr:phosphonate ABC transporter, permease protein PhnE [Epulopiscium sp. SCG-C07WGA-EpuloA2]
MKYTLSNGKQVEQKRSKTIFIVLAVIAMSWISVVMTDFSFKVLFERGKRFFDILISMWPPDIGYLKFIWTPLFDTIKMSLLGSAIGSLCAIPFAILASSNIIHNKIIISIIRLFLSLVRTFPTLVVALIATYIVGLGTLAGTIAIAVFTFAYVGKILYEQIETVDMGPYEAIESFGATKLMAFTAGILPQILPSYIANCLFCFEGNVRYAALLGYVGAGGLGLILNEKVSWREYQSVGMILVALFISVMIIEAISHYLRKKLT